MNRRNFFRKLVLGTAAFSILPPATTYSRIWKATRQVNPEWVKAPFGYSVLVYGDASSFRDFAGQWKWIEYTPGIVTRLTNA